MSTMVVVTLSGVPSVGGSVTWGRTGWIFAVTNVSLTSDVMMELLPTPSSPHTQIRTAEASTEVHEWGKAAGEAAYRWPLQGHRYCGMAGKQRAAGFKMEMATGARTGERRCQRWRDGSSTCRCRCRRWQQAWRRHVAGLQGCRDQRGPAREGSSRAPGLQGSRAGTPTRLARCPGGSVNGRPRGGLDMAGG